MTAELFVIVTFPLLMSCVSVAIHSRVELLASGWGATRYLPSSAEVSDLVVRVIDSPGLIHEFVGGACSRIRLLVTLVSEGVIRLASGVVVVSA